MYNNDNSQRKIKDDESRLPGEEKVIMFQANYPVIGAQECYPVYLTGIGISDPEFHTHREEGLISHQILFSMSGKGKIIVGNKEYTAGKGSIFYVASGEPHTYYPIDGDWTTYWVVFRGDSLDALMARLGFSRHVVKTINDITEVKKLYDQIAAAAREPGGGAGHCSMLVYQYILLMHKLLIVQQENHTGTVVDNAIVYMEKNYKDDISLQTLASVCGISTQHFCRVFHDKIGMRPMEYWIQMHRSHRLERGSGMRMQIILELCSKNMRESLRENIEIVVIA